MVSVMKMKRRFTDAFSEGLDIPQELLSETPLAQLRGKRSVCIENHCGIAEYSDECVKVSVKRGIIAVHGEQLTIARLTRRRVEIRGRIRAVELQ